MRSGLNDKNAKLVWVVDAPEGEWREDYRDYIKGLPSNFHNPLFWVLASKWERAGEFVVGDDEVLMQNYLKQQAGG